MQAALKAVLEPVFEADFVPAPYGFRPNRRAHDAIAEIVYLAQRGTVSWFDAEARTVRYDVVGGEDRDLRKCGSVGQTSGRPLPQPAQVIHPTTGTPPKRSLRNQAGGSGLNSHLDKLRGCLTWQVSRASCNRSGRRPGRGRRGSASPFVRIGR